MAGGELKRSAGCTRPTGEDGAELEAGVESAFSAKSFKHALMESALSREALELNKLVNLGLSIFLPISKARRVFIVGSSGRMRPGERRSEISLTS